MTPPSDQPAEAVKGPSVPADAHAALLKATARGATTDAAAKKTGLPKLTAWKYLDVMRRAGDVRLRPTADGLRAEWVAITNRRSA
ncbi:hypothetical protein ABZ917_17120 [Nonomuraea wenchangensis]